jgi:hypothetical protein
MKYGITIMLIVMSVLFISGGCSRGKVNREYAMDKVSDTEPRLHITRITVTNKETKVNFKYVYKGMRVLAPGAAEALAVAPPGHAGALSIIAANGGKKYNLLKVEGVPTLPAYTILKEGTVAEFVLVFERLDDDVKKFDITEDTISTTISWKFINIQLS